jgi:hypothetical protein
MVLSTISAEKYSGAEIFCLICHIPFILLDEFVFSKCAVVQGILWIFIKDTLFDKFIVQITFILLCIVCNEKTLFDTPPQNISYVVPAYPNLIYCICVSLCVPWLAHTSWSKHTNTVEWEYRYSELSSWNFLHHPRRFKYCQHCALRAQITCWIRS